MLNDHSVGGQKVSAKNVEKNIKKLLPEVGFEPTPSFEDRNLSPTP